MPDTTPQVETLQVDADPVAITADADSIVGKAPFAGTVTSCTYTAVAAVTGAASPASRTLSLINKGQTGVGTTVVATLALVGGVNLVAFDEKTIVLSSTAADLVVAANDILSWNSLHIGATGLVDPGGTVVVAISRS